MSMIDLNLWNKKKLNFIWKIQIKNEFSLNEKSITWAALRTNISFSNAFKIYKNKQTKKLISRKCMQIALHSICKFK